MIKRIFLACLFIIVFNVGAFRILLQIPPAFGVIWPLALGTGFLWWYLRENPKAVRRRALVRVRAPRGSPYWVVTAIGSALLFTLGIAGFIDMFAPPIDPDYLIRFEVISDYVQTLGGFIAMAALAVLTIPIAEEFVFRGHIQHSLERRYGPGIAIGATSLLFMLGHFGVPHWSILLISLSIGIANGTAVYLFQSIWPGVAIHSIWNGSMLALGAIHADATSTFGNVSPGYLLPLSVVLVGAGLAGWYSILRVGRPGLRESMRG